VVLPSEYKYSTIPAKFTQGGLSASFIIVQVKF